MEIDPTLWPNARFLTVDDSSSMCTLLLIILNQLGIKNVVQMANGIEAWDELQNPSQPIDIVLCDWMMPKMTGIELLKRVRANEKLAAVPFVMLTAEVEDEKMKLAFEAGADGFIGKPFSVEQVRKTLTEVYQKKKVAPA